MKVTAPQMGNLEILLKDLFKRLNVEYIVPPKSNSEALSLGVKYGPQLACLPLKITIGNMIQGLEMGADTLIMAGGYGPCRFGYYAQVQRIIIEQAGYKFKMIVIEPPSGGLSKFVAAFKEIAPEKSTLELWKIIKNCFKKVRAIDFVEKKALQIRCFEEERGSTTKAMKRAIKIINDAFTPKEIKEAQEKALAILNEVDIDLERRVLKVGIVGEFFILLEPFVNFDIEEYLGHKGIYLERSVYVSDWISPTSKNVVFGKKEAEIEKYAEPYLSHWVGGEGQPTVGHSAAFAKEGFDGAIHLFPFTCMPEIIAESVLPGLSKDYDFPILTLVIDEQTGRAGVATRLEAFIDLLASRSKYQNKKVLIGGKI